MPPRSVLPLIVCLIVVVCASRTNADAQRLTPDAVRWTIEDACGGDNERLPLYFLQWQTDAPPLAPIQRAGLPDVHRAAYALAEQHLKPYEDPRHSSTWTGTKPMAVIQPTLIVDIAPDTTFERWETENYGFELNWDDPPIMRTDTIHPFRPVLRNAPEDLLYATRPYRENVIEFFLPPESGMTQEERTRRIDCLDDSLGLMDWVRTSIRMHSPPHLSLTFNERLDRAIAGFGWGLNGGLWVAYRRVGSEWRIIQHLGRWQY
jgi:hypothetical protein